MARSQETFSKKEKEKKKQMKARDKEAKREARKSNTLDGSDLDSMMAYVDENGMITSTPPDPTKKKKVNHENIVLGVPRQAEVNPEDAIRKGKVTMYNDSKGFGFIQDADSGESIFVHTSKVAEPIGVGDKVIFEIEMGERGAAAVNVKHDRP